jgi:hypothetical protein
MHRPRPLYASCLKSGHAYFPRAYEHFEFPAFKIAVVTNFAIVFPMYLSNCFVRLSFQLLFAEAPPLSSMNAPTLVRRLANRMCDILIHTVCHTASRGRILVVDNSKN